MLVKSIFRFSEDGAEVIITDGEFDILCFCYPCYNLSVNSVLTGDLGCLEPDGVMRASTEEYRIEKLPTDYFAYNVTGQIVSRAEGRVRVGGILLDLGRSSMPGDVMDGEFVSFSCWRFDIIFPHER